jgi:hypothetical protein
MVGFQGRTAGLRSPAPGDDRRGDYLAVLLPTYGHFDGEACHGARPMGKWLEYRMLNTVRFEGGKLAVTWFGADPVAERQQTGAARGQRPRDGSQGHREEDILACLSSQTQA